MFLYCPVLFTSGVKLRWRLFWSREQDPARCLSTESFHIISLPNYNISRTITNTCSLLWHNLLPYTLAKVRSKFPNTHLFMFLVRFALRKGKDKKKITFLGYVFSWKKKPRASDVITASVCILAFPLFNFCNAWPNFAKFGVNIFNWVKPWRLLIFKICNNNMNNAQKFEVRALFTSLKLVVKSGLVNNINSYFHVFVQ